MRVSADKLDTFLARDGELLVARRRVQSRSEDVAALREFVARWADEWHSIERTLKTWLVKNGPETAERSANGRLPRRLAAILGRTGNNLRQLEKDLDKLGAVMAGDHRLLKQTADALDNELRRVRMLPFADACQGLDRMVRDLAQSGGKDVDLVIEGGAVELDRSILEGLKDPLRHLVRNAVDHGAEPPDERRRSGKPPRARIVVTAVLRGSQVEVSVSDDGRGIDTDALREQLRRRGLPEPADERQLADAVFLPGLSTARLITDVSGRGVGLDVVKGRVEALHGTIALTFTPGTGTRFALAVPLTLTTLRALLVAAGGQTFALPGTNVQKLVRIDPADLVSVAGREMLSLGDTPFPVVGLAESLGRALASRPAHPASGPLRSSPRVSGAWPLWWTNSLRSRKLLSRTWERGSAGCADISGATILPSGRIALVLNAANLVRSALAEPPPARRQRPPRGQRRPRKSDCWSWTTQ